MISATGNRFIHHILQSLLNLAGMTDWLEAAATRHADSYWAGLSWLR